MKNLKKREYLPLTVLVFGLLGMVLRRMLYRFGPDAKNLLPRSHPLEIALWVVVIAAAAVILLSVRKLDGSAAYEDNFSASSGAALSHCLMAGCILVMVLNQTPGMAGAPGLLWQVMGLVSAPALVWAGICRRKGKKPFFLIHAALCVFLLLHVVTNYQRWSGNPQLQDYCFDLFAAAALMLFSYYTAMFEADAGKRRMQLIWGLFSLLLCAIALSGTEFPGLYTAGALWAVTDLCRLKPVTPPESEASHETA